MIVSANVLLVLTVLLLYTWARKRKNYWKDRNVPHIESPLLLGNFASTFFLRESVTKAINRIYYHPKAQGQPFVGCHMFYKPALFIRDPGLVKHIMVNNFNDFSARFSPSDQEADPIGAYNLFQVRNPMWNTMRKKLTPVFTVAKMKLLFENVNSFGTKLNERLQMVLAARNAEVEIKQLAGLYLLDAISLVALAVETNALGQDMPSDFFRMMTKSFISNYWQNLSASSFWFLPDLFRKFKLAVFSKDFNNTLRTVFWESCNNRIESKTNRGDLIDALIDIKSQEQNETEAGKST